MKKPKGTPGYLAEIQRLFSALGWTQDVSPAGFLRDWKSFVELCSLGYPNSIYEYFNDIRVREWIETILASPDLANYSEYHEFRNLVAEVDVTFKALLQAGLTTPAKRLWWEGGVLKFAGPELAADFQRDYGIAIETRPV